MTTSWNNLGYRSINSNTWGFSKKIGEHTFGDYHYTQYRLENRDLLYYKKISCTWNISNEQRTAFRNNLRKVTKILDIAGYIPGVALIAGTIRIVAATILGRMIKENIRNGTFKGELASEAKRTYKAQIHRGVCELIPVIGSLINLYRDLRWYNIWNERRVRNLTEKL